MYFLHCQLVYWKPSLEVPWRAHFPRAACYAMNVDALQGPTLRPPTFPWRRRSCGSAGHALLWLPPGPGSLRACFRWQQRPGEQLRCRVHFTRPVGRTGPELSGDFGCLLRAVLPPAAQGPRNGRSGSDGARAGLQTAAGGSTDPAPTAPWLRESLTPKGRSSQAVPPIPTCCQSCSTSPAAAPAAARFCVRAKVEPRGICPPWSLCLPTRGRHLGRASPPPLFLWVLGGPAGFSNC